MERERERGSNQLVCRWPAMCIHGDKQQQEREWVLGGE